MFLIDPLDGSIFDANPAAAKYYGWTRDKLRSMKISDINILTSAEIKIEMAYAVQSLRNRFNFRHRLSDGTVRDVEVYTGPILVNDRELLYSLVHDVTERTIAEQKIRLLLQEKEILMKELHHRLKNNINSIHGLLNLQSNRSGNPEVKQVLSDAARRLRSMSILYDKLSYTDYQGKMSSRDYFVPLVRDIVAAFPNRDMIEVSAEVEDVAIDTKYLFNLGIIVNEIVSNSVKYAFGIRGSGKISIRAELKRGRFYVTVSDDGKGLPEGFDVKQSGGLGLQLVQMLIHQMEGTMSVSSEAGTHYQIGVQIDPS